jgi:hypothetical protein
LTEKNALGEELRRSDFSIDLQDSSSTNSKSNSIKIPFEKIISSTKSANDLA